MASRTALICNRYTAGCTKTEPKILRPKTSKKRETHPIQPEKGEIGCVVGAGEGSSGWRRMKLGEKGRYRAGKGGTTPP